MIVALASESGALRPVDASDPACLARAVWIDVQDPTDDERRAIELHTGLYVAPAGELQEIESSSRLSMEDGTLYLSMPLVQHTGLQDVRSQPIGFALSRERLLTVRFAPSHAFDVVHKRAPTFDPTHQSSTHVFVTLLEVIVDRLADDLEQIRDELDHISRRIFRDDADAGRAPRRQDAALQRVLRSVGMAGDLIARIRDTELGVARILPYTMQRAEAFLPGDTKARLETLREDVASLASYDSYLNEKVQFLLDATLGFINIAQNNIMKIFTVFSVAGIPPVLVAGIYGMNFKGIHEYDWSWGYPYGLALIAVTGIVPLLAFKWRGWL